jgi:hypothetical protein
LLGLKIKYFILTLARGSVDGSLAGHGIDDDAFSLHLQGRKDPFTVGTVKFMCEGRRGRPS